MKMSLFALLISMWATGVLAKLPKYPDCGKTSDLVRAVARGPVAEVGEFPWLAAVLCPECPERVINDPHGRRCGGSLITEYFILTAAHCFYRRSETNSENP